jgi:hypothetical protein
VYVNKVAIRDRYTIHRSMHFTQWADNEAEYAHTFPVSVPYGK